MPPLSAPAVCATFIGPESSIFTRASFNFPAFAIGAEQQSFSRSLDTYPYFVEGQSVVDAKLDASQLNVELRLESAD